MVLAVGHGSVQPCPCTVALHPGWLCLTGPRDGGCAPGPCSQLFLAWLLVVGLFLLHFCPSADDSVGSWTRVIPYPPW